MLSPPAGFISAIAEETLKIAEIYDITLLSGDSYYFTSHDEDISWGTTCHLYTSLPITRDTLSTEINMQPQQVTVSLSGLASGCSELLTFLQQNRLTGATLSIKRVLYDQSPASGLEIILFSGLVEVEFNRQEIKLTCVSVLDSLNARVPRNIYQDNCNNTLFGAICGRINTIMVKRIL